MSNSDNKKRSTRIRKKLKKVNKNRFRLTVFRSSKNISAQIIDDKDNNEDDGNNNDNSNGGHNHDDNEDNNDTNNELCTQIQLWDEKTMINL